MAPSLKPVKRIVEGEGLFEAGEPDNLLAGRRREVMQLAEDFGELYSAAVDS